MAKARMPHAGHDKHLCYLINIGFQGSNPTGLQSHGPRGQIYVQDVWPRRVRQ